MTGIRGAAAIFVMIYHFHLRMVATGPLSTIVLHGYLAVDLFFILSGFVMAHVYGKALQSGTFRQRSFLLHRIARIFPLYILATLAFLALGRGGSPSLPALAANLVMLQSLGNWPSLDPPAWSVSTEMVAYLLFPFIAVACLRSSPKIALATGCMALLAILVMTLAASRHYIGAPIAKGDLDLFFSPYTLVRCLAGFTIGQLAYRLHDNAHVRRALSGNFLQCMVLLLVMATMAQALSDFPAYLALIALIVAIAQDRGVLRYIFASPPLMFLGKVSFGIYLLHFQAIGTVDRLEGEAHMLGLGVEASDWIASLAVSAMVTALAWMLHRIFESPLRRMIRRIEKRPASGPLSV
ncbi:acyltransferase [Novosphingobium sp. TCA1]|uniref:acyltransferase family protein n=1 Tax=Novosphingobium sp. TCA1 TaxID=2682474 RepID=UPI00130BF716|nr:acyltransferase [Novosphingobium sp. TCA1]GFE73920.1 acyltransferase [Novosphingobium sp. TCA1]